jgi:poly(3-hydroxybutyrate) depolymerase
MFETFGFRHGRPGAIVTGMKNALRVLSMAHCLMAVSLGETVYFNGKDAKAGYYLVPENAPQNATKLWVAVDVHGAGGLRGEDRGKELMQLLGPEPLIVIVPSFTDGYQAGDGKWAKQLIGNFKEVAKNYPVHDKMFVHGHSGGGQFAHRFAFAEPGHVIGVSAHSSGSWACAGGHGKINNRAKNIPFAISCGEKDTALSTPDSAHTRIAWYKLFEAEMKKEGFDVDGRTWPAVGHGVSLKLVGEQVRECFLKATSP